MARRRRCRCIPSSRAVAQGYSLWSDSQAALFKDARALNVGDILTVDIQINDKGSFDNETNRSRTNSAAA
jgi:flagellar L-ring protein precursor FlgH